MREAIAYADEHARPLLRRLTAAKKSDSFVTATYLEEGAEYRLSAPDMEIARLTRGRMLQWLREELADGNEGAHIDRMERVLGKAATEALRDRVSQRGGSALTERTFARIYGGPVKGDAKVLKRWLGEKRSVDEIIEIDDPEQVLSICRRLNPAYAIARAAVTECEPYMPWLDPDSGEEVGFIGLLDSPMADDTQVFSSPVAVTCFQWTCDLLKLGVRIEPRPYGEDDVSE